MATWKNFEFKMWLKEINASCLSQEKLKLEAMKVSEKFDKEKRKRPFRKYVTILKKNTRKFGKKLHTTYLRRWVVQMAK